ncbi:major facilitator superfamily transporter [Colletotrichum graminicola]|nr:major facilitator superfamily transporter [Colletotrichum graminicola]
MDSHSDPPPDQDTVVDDAAPSRASTDMHHLTESTPLLLAGAPSSPLPPKRPGTGRSRTESLIKAAAAIHVPKIHNANTIAALFCVIIGIGSSASGLWVVPSTRLVEDVVCREYYGLLGSGDASAGGPIDERQCKEDVIQSKVAMIFAVYATLQAVVGALATFPWGIIADRFGRKKVFSLAVLGMILDQLWFLLLCAFPKTFPMKALWLGPFFLLIGGGNGVLSAVVFSMISDVTTSENRSQEVHERPCGVHGWKPLRPRHRRVDDGENRTVAGRVGCPCRLLEYGLHHPPDPGDKAGGPGRVGPYRGRAGGRLARCRRHVPHFPPAQGVSGSPQVAVPCRFGGGAARVVPRHRVDLPVHEHLRLEALSRLAVSDGVPLVTIRAGHYPGHPRHLAGHLKTARLTEGAEVLAVHQRQRARPLSRPDIVRRAYHRHLDPGRVADHRCLYWRPRDLGPRCGLGQLRA